MEAVWGVRWDDECVKSRQKDILRVVAHMSNECKLSFTKALYRADKSESSVRRS